MRSILFSAGLTAVLALTGCGAGDKKDESDPSAGGGTGGATGGGVGGTLSNALSAAFPGTLALSIFPQTVEGASLSLTDEAAAALEKKTPKEKIEENVDTLNGNVDTCFRPGLFSDRKGEAVTCYEFDNDMNPFNNGPAGNGGTADGKHTTGEACMVASARQEILEATQYVERALDSVKAMLCQVSKSGGDTALPTAADGQKDYSTYLSEAAGTAATITKATMELVTSDKGDEGYKTLIGATVGGQAITMSLTYFAGDTASTDSGIINYLAPAAKAGEQPGNSDPNNTANMTRVVSVKFSREVSDVDATKRRNRFEVRKAHMEKTLDHLDEGGLVNFAAIPENAVNDKSNNMNLVAFDIDPETNEGKLAYWRNPGGSYSEAARGFLFDIDVADAGGLKGCGASGANQNLSIRKALTTDAALAPTGYWHPFAGSNTHTDKDARYTGGGQGPLITVQCFAQDTDGVYQLDNEATKTFSTTTDRDAIDARGYDVVPVASNFIEPPHPPVGPPPSEAAGKLE